MFTIETMIGNHLQCNHYPPVSTVFVPTCIQAIDAANLEDWDAVIEMPNGKSLTVAEIIEGLHLDYFLEEGVEL